LNSDSISSAASTVRERDLGHDDEIGSPAGIFLVPPRPHPKGPAPGGIGLGDQLGRVDDHAAGGKVGARDVFEKRTASGIGRRDEVEGRVAKLGRVMRRYRGRHSHGDALRAVRQQIGECARQNDRLVLRAVISRLEVDCVLVDAVQQEMRNLGQAGLGVAHGGRIVAVHISEVTLPVDQRIALGKILRQPYQRIVYRLVAVRMELADHVAHDPRTFLEGGARIKAQLLHGIQEPPMHRLEPVAGVRQGTIDDGRERIGKIALFERFMQRDLFRALISGGNQLLDHDEGLMPGVFPNKSHDEGASADLPRNFAAYRLGPLDSEPVRPRFSRRSGSRQ